MARPAGFDFPPGADQIELPMYVCCAQCGAAVAHHPMMTERHLKWHDELDEKFNRLRVFG